MKSWIQLAQQQSKIFELAIPLIIGETYTISMNSNEPFMISVGGVFVGETVDGSLEFIATNSGDVMITSYGDISMEFEIKLELGSQTEWSPAPEDGYGLDLPNGAYHIQGGNSFSKTVEEGVHVGVNTYAWGNIMLNGTELPINDNERYREDSNKLEFTGNNLDFIAVDPFIGLSSSVEELYENNMRSLSLKDKMKPINILNLTREDAHDNYPYPLNWETIPVNDRSEIVVPDNQIMDKRRPEYAPSLFNAIEGLSYTPFDSETYGVLYLEPLDTIEVIDMNEVSHVSLVTSNRLKFTSGIKESLTSELPSKLKEKYALVTDNERQSMRVYFLVDKQNGIIQGLVEELGAVKDQTAELTIKVDEIELKVNNTSNGSVIGNFNPQDYLGWEGGSRLLYVAEYSKLRYLSGLTYAMGFQPVRMAGSLSEWGLSFFNNGSATSPFGYVVPTEVYSYKAKVQRFKPFSIDLLEYKDMITPFHKSTRFTFNNPQAYVQFTSELDSQTAFVRIKFNVTGVTPSDRFEITENMYNRGLPKEYFVSGTEALVYAQSNINILDNKIGLVVDEVKVVDNKTEINKGSIEVMGGQIDLNAQSINSVSNDIHNAGVNIKAEEGVTIYGKNFKIKNEARDKTIFGVNTIEGQEGVSMVGDFSTVDGTIQLNSSKKEIVIGNVSLKNPYNDTKFLDINSHYVAIKSENGQAVNSLGMGMYDKDGNYHEVGFMMQLRNDRSYPWTTPTNNVSPEMHADVISVMRIKTRFGRTIEIQGDLVPQQHNAYMIGSTGVRFNTIFLQNQPNVASDKNLKTNISDIDDMLLDSFENLQYKSFDTKHDDKHSFGFIAQDVESCLYDYARKKWGDDHEKHMDKFKVLSRDGEFMSLLYAEVQIIMQAVERRRSNRLEDRLNELEERLTKLELML